MAKTLKELSFLDLAPSSITGDAQVQAIIQAADPELHRVAGNIEKVLILPRLDELPENVLDLLAWQWHVDFYELARNIEAKRDFIRTSILWHRKKGTVWAILKALDMIGVEGTFTPWWELKDDEGDVIGEPYTFALDAKLTDEYWKRSDWETPTQNIRRIVRESKAKRSWMSNLYAHIDRKADSNIHVGGSVSMGRLQVVRMARPTSGQTTTNPAVGAAVSLGRFQTIRMAWPTSGRATAGLTAGGVVSVARHQTLHMARPVSGSTQAALRGGLGFSVGIHMTFDIR